MTTDSVTLQRDSSEASAAVTIDGTATGVLVGGNLDAIRTEAGAGLPSLKGDMACTLRPSHSALRPRSTPAQEP